MFSYYTEFFLWLKSRFTKVINIKFKIAMNKICGVPHCLDSKQLDLGILEINTVQLLNILIITIIPQF